MAGRPVKIRKASAKSLKAFADALRNMRQRTPADYQGLPDPVDVRKMAADANLEVIAGSSKVELNGTKLRVPRYYTLTDTNVEIAKALVARFTPPDPDLGPDIDTATAWASVLCLPEEDFRVFDKKIDSDFTLANIFEVPTYFVDIRRAMLENGV